MEQVGVEQVGVEQVGVEQVGVERSLSTGSVLAEGLYTKSEDLTSWFLFLILPMHLTFFILKGEELKERSLEGLEETFWELGDEVLEQVFVSALIPLVGVPLPLVRMLPLPLALTVLLTPDLVSRFLAGNAVADVDLTKYVFAACGGLDVGDGKFLGIFETFSGERTLL